MKIPSLLFILLCSSLVVAQQKITVDVQDLPPELLEKLKSKENIEKQTKQITNKMEEVGEWAGIGKEIGSAVNSALGAVIENADRFGKTEVGHFTMFLVFWNIAGKDILRIVIFMPIAFLLCLVILHSYKKRVIGQRVLVKTYPVEGFKLLAKEYRWEDGMLSRSEAAGTLHLLAAIVIIFFCSIAAFA